MNNEGTKNLHIKVTTARESVTTVDLAALAADTPPDDDDFFQAPFLTGPGSQSESEVFRTHHSPNKAGSWGALFHVCETFEAGKTPIILTFASREFVPKFEVFC